MSALLTDLLPIPSVGLSVVKVYCGKMADWIQMLFGVASGVGRGTGVLDGGGDCRKGRGSFGDKCGASHCNQCGRCCIDVQKSVNQSSCHWGWWGGSVEKWVQQGKGAVSRLCHCHWFKWHIFNRNAFGIVRGKLTIFPCGQYITGKNYSFAFQRNSQVQDRSWGLWEICKNVTVISHKNCTKQQLQAAAFYARLTSHRHGNDSVAS